MHLLTASALLALVLNSVGGYVHSTQILLQDDDVRKNDLRCILPKPQAPSGEGGLHSSTDFWSKEIMNRQIHRLSAVVRVPTVSYDDMGDVHHDTRWDVFGELHEVLESLFPITSVPKPCL